MSVRVPLYKPANFSRNSRVVPMCRNLFARKHVDYYATIHQMAIYT
ncbi:hypothetical protein SAMN04515618_10897 [Collimonas sp. OK307]|nr:hypothetical protein SAMN04515618_10897 [Collimonas sp. OK307]